MRKSKFIMCLVVCLLTASTVVAEPRPPDPEWRIKVSRFLINQRTRESVTAAVGAPPTGCIQSSVATDLCEWSLGNTDRGWKPLSKAIETDARIALLCEFPIDGGQRADGSCMALPRRSNRDMFGVGIPRPPKWTSPDTVDN
jgi:hypothetical protein